jgi:hypothetical protein
MTFVVGQTYQTVSTGKVKILELNSPANGGHTPMIAMAENGSVSYYRKDGTISNSPGWTIVMPKAVGYINVYPSPGAAAYRIAAGQITIPIEYEAPNEHSK